MLVSKIKGTSVITLTEIKKQFKLVLHSYFIKIKR